MSPSIVLLVGTGAVDGAWKPIYRALRKRVSPETLDDPDLANLEMARLVHLLRFFHGRRPDMEREALESLRNLRHTIAEELQQAMVDGELKVRASFLQMLNALSAGGSLARIRVITTNWDTVVDQAIHQIAAELNVLHLHGSLSDPNTLYLPSEISTEAYRPKAELVHHAKTTLEAIRALEAATELVIFGLSLSPLDAEVCQVLWAGRMDRPPLDRVVVVDLQPKTVAQRLEVVLRARALPAGGIVCQKPA